KTSAVSFDIKAIKKTSFGKFCPIYYTIATSLFFLSAKTKKTAREGADSLFACITRRLFP
ncbi:hypothetical protein, partial [Candidatus Ruminimicrobium bovinum]|uniref:hypothetical protein n=1 Tax=Candidatus Ruminimicrobium bovinum TaxID=3242779 RepID=UPI0039B98479